MSSARQFVKARLFRFLASPYSIPEPRFSDGSSSTAGTSRRLSLVLRLASACLLLAVPLPESAQAQVSFLQALPLPTAASGALVTADFNLDGKPDLVSANGTVMLGNGDGTFTTGTTLSLGGFPIFTADFNGDGKPDLLTTNYNTFYLTVYLGNGDGTFQAAKNTYVAAGFYYAAVADLNGDGIPDVLGTANSLLFVFLGNGDGTFGPATTYSVSGSQIFAGDFNGDGKTDVLISTGGPVVVMLNNGNGTFGPPIISTTPGNVSAVGDLNNDGKLDLVVLGFDYGVTSFAIYTVLGNGDGTFQAANPNPLIPDYVAALALSDFNGDGKLDLVFESNFFVQVYLGNGDGTFASADTYSLNPTSSTGYNIIVADFNNDGKQDLAVGSSVFLGNGDGTFEAAPGILAAVGVLFGSAISGDFNGDSYADLAVISVGTMSYTGGVDIFLGSASGQLSLINAYSLGSETFPSLLAAADFNGDGKLDLLVSGSAGLTVLLGNGDGSFGSVITSTACQINAPGFTYSDFVGDFNGDHRPDVAWVVNNGAELNLCLGNGDGTFQSPLTYLVGSGTRVVIGADFNNDGKLDAAVSSQAGFGILLGNGDGTFQPVSFDTTCGGTTVGDFNNDGNVDLIGAGAVCLGNGDGTFRLLSQPQISPGFPVDLNGDGILDLVVNGSAGYGGFSNALFVFLGNGDGTFGNSTFLEEWAHDFTYGGAVAAADFNGDHKSDLAVSTGEYNYSVNGIQIFLNTTTPAAAVSVTPVSVSFASRIVNTTSSATPVTVKNTGSNSLNITSITFTGANGGEFGQTNNCTGAIASGASCTVNVTFKPTASGAAAASLSIAGNMANSPKVVALSGTGTSSSNLGLGVASGSSESQTVTAGATASYTLSIGGAGFAGVATVTCTGAPTGAKCTVTPANPTVSATTATTLSVSVTTTARTTAVLSPDRKSSSPWLWAVAIVGFTILPVASARKHSPLRVIRGLPLMLLLLICSCGGGGGTGGSTAPSSGTPAGTYTLTVTATSGSVTQTVPLTLIVQ